MSQAQQPHTAESARIRQLEEQLRESEERQRVLAEGIRDFALFCMGPDGRITSWSKGARRLTDYESEEVLGRHSSLLFTLEDRDRGLPQRELDTAANDGSAADENWIARKDGTRFWASGFSSARRGQDGGLLGFVKIFRDLSEKQKAHQALRESELRLRAALAAAEMGTWLWQVATDKQTLDENLHRLIGAPPGRTVRDLEDFLTFVHPEDRDSVKEAFLRSVRDGSGLLVEFRVPRPDGSVRWLRDKGEAYGNGQVQYLTGACVDITERKRAEEDRARLAAIVESSEDAIVSKALDGTIRSWNAGAERLFGYTPAEAIGQPITLIIPPELLPEEQEILGRLRRGERIEHFETVRVAKDGRRIAISLTISPVCNAQGQVVGASKIARDITERKRAEEALREADRRKDEFLAMLGHELRNPLAPLRSVTEILRRQKPDGETLERTYAMMERQVSHLSRLVDDLLDVSRITRGLVELRKEPVNLAEIADQAVEMATPAIEGRGHQLSLAFPRKLRVVGDATRLRQVIFNLLNNAAKYTDRGGRIWLTVEREGEYAVVRVRDNGAGMRAELVPIVFDIFTQGERSLDRSQGGLGLGLTLVKRLVEMHGGTAEAKSEGPGKGSEFTVRLPALAAEEAKPTPTRVAGPPQAAVQVPRALVIDDNIDVAESMTWMLDGLAREIKMVHSGAAALEMASGWKPDLIVCDIGMPGMDGYETCRRLRRLPGLQAVVIAAVSGYGQEEDRRRSKESGFDRHLVKPIGRATLEELVKSAANR